VDTASLFWWWISQWIDPHAETEHGWLILGISAWLLWRGLGNSDFGMRLGTRASAGEARALNAEGTEAAEPEHPRSEFRVGQCTAPLVAILVALLLHAVGFVAQQTRISIVAFLIFAWGVVALADPRWGRAAAFPLGFLVFAIPLNVLDSVGFWLRLGVIDATEAIAHGLGLHVLRSGTQLLAPDGKFQYDVAAACSGVRSLMALAALSLLIGYIRFHTASRRALMLVLCFPLTYFGNLARVVAIVLAAHFGDERWAGLTHDLMGYGVFVIVLGGVMIAATAVERKWPEPIGDADERTTLNPKAAFFGAAGSRVPLYLVGGAILAMMVGEMLFLQHLASTRPAGKAGVALDASGVNPIELPAFIGTDWIGRRTDVTPVERAVLPADTGFSRRTYVSLADRAHAVFVSIVLSGRDRTSIHRPEICLVGQGWTLASAGTHDFEYKTADRGVIHATLLRGEIVEPKTHRKLTALTAYWFVSADAVVATHWQRFWHDAWNRLRHGKADRWAYVLVQADATDGDAAALSRMQTVLEATLPVFQRAR
jgi:EpsI family protein